MHARYPTFAPRPRPLIAALAALACSPVWADEPSPWYVGASQAFTHDTNVYRLAEGVQPDDGKGRADNYWSSGLLGGFNQPYGRQRFYGAANLNYNKYLKHELSNTSYGANAGWDWATIEKLSGNFNASANRSLASLNGNAVQPSTGRNQVTSDQLSTNIRWGGAGALGLQADYAHSRVHYSDPSFASSESSADSGSLGAFYNVSPDLRVGAAFRLTRTESPNAIQTPTGFQPDTVDGRNIDLSADWRYTAQTAVNARLSYTRQTHSNSSGSEFSGLTGAISASYVATAKTGFTLAYNRDAGTNGSFFNAAPSDTRTGDTRVSGLVQNSQVSDNVSLGANYAATAKISANAGLQYRRSKIGNDSAASAGGQASYNDTYRSASLGATWAIARAWQLGCNLSHETRSTTSLIGYGYAANVAACNAQFTLQ